MSCGALVMFGAPHDRVRIIGEQPSAGFGVAPTDQHVKELLEGSKHICLITGRHDRNANARTT